MDTDTPGVALVEELYAELGGEESDHVGVSFGLSTGNGVTTVPTPTDVWGDDPGVFDYAPCAENLRASLQSVVASAEYNVDISTLAPLADGLFLEAIKAGLKDAVSRNNRLVIRVLQGVGLLTGFDRAKQDLLDWIKGLGMPPTVAIYGASIRWRANEWNHSKLVIADGKIALCGGHNLWSDTYCSFAPVQDVSIVVRGPAVAVAQSFLNQQWTSATKERHSSNPTEMVYLASYMNGLYFNNSLPVIRQPPEAGAGSSSVLALARMGRGLVAPDPSTDASRTARLSAISKATSRVCLSQQMLGCTTMCGGWDAALMTALAKSVSRGVDVYIIISDKGAANGSGTGYSGFGVKETATQMKTEVGLQTGLSGAALTACMSKHVHVAPIRVWPQQASYPTGEAWKWRRSTADDVEVIREPANHAKVYIIDDIAFYVGSDNAYPINSNPFGLQEFGFLVGGSRETQLFVESYWSKVWGYSRLFEHPWADDSADANGEAL